MTKLTPDQMDSLITYIYAVVEERFTRGSHGPHVSVSLEHFRRAQENLYRNLSDD
jgi:hypothetical protein